MLRVIKLNFKCGYLSVLLDLVVEVLFTVFSFELFKLTQTIENRDIIVKFEDFKTID
jgi:hypothetical protein